MKTTAAQQVSSSRLPGDCRGSHLRAELVAKSTGSGARRVCAADAGRIGWRADAGSGGGMALMMLGAAVALMMILGLVVDGGAKARALDRAGAIAAEAARAAAGTYRPGNTAIDPTMADRAAQDFLAASGATGTITVAGHTVTATATLHQAAVFLPLMGIDEFTVTATGDAHVIYQPGGAP